jgi:hypothetical protein
MPLDAVRHRADHLATTVGPHETLVALARLEDALAQLGTVLEAGDGDPDGDESVIDLREVRSVMERVQPLIDSADERIGELRSTLENLS